MGRREGLYYGLSVGILQDVLFGQLIGVYALSMMVASYFAGLVALLFQRSIAVVFVTVSLVLFGHEWLLYSLFRLFSSTPLDVQWIVSKQIIPGVGYNVVFAILLYIPLLRLCERVQGTKETAHE